MNSNIFVVMKKENHVIVIEKKHWIYKSDGFHCLCRNLNFSEINC